MAVRAQVPLSPPWYQFIAEVDWLLHDCDYIRAAGTLTAIRDTVLATRRVTDGQRHALDSIRAINRATVARLIGGAV